MTCIVVHVQTIRDAKKRINILYVIRYRNSIIAQPTLAALHGWPLYHPLYRSSAFNTNWKLFIHAYIIWHPWLYWSYGCARVYINLSGHVAVQCQNLSCHCFPCLHKSQRGRSILWCAKCYSQARSSYSYALGVCRGMSCLLPCSMNMWNTTLREKLCVTEPHSQLLDHVAVRNPTRIMIIDPQLWLSALSWQADMANNFLDD